MNTSRHNRGMSLVELCIAMTLLSLALLAVGASVMAGRGTYDSGMAVGDVEAKARRTVDKIVSELSGAGRITLTPNPVAPLGTSTLSYQTNDGFVGGALIWSNVNNIALQYAPGEVDDGLDNDSNGLVDECEVVLTRDVGLGTEMSTTLGGPIREFFAGETDDGTDENGNGLLDEQGLSFAIVGNVLTVRVTVEGVDPEGVIITRSVETAVQLRN